MDGLFGSENQLWEPNRNNDVEKLAMTESGESINDIYTKEVVDEIFIFGNVYKSFLKLLEKLEEDEVIEEFLPFPYDWRYDVFTVATEPVVYANGETNLLVEEIKRLAEESHTKKVTIIGHSNGGLVAKALLHEYGDTELAGLVDKIVMVGTPQLGTPTAIGALLHGLEQNSALKLIIDESTAREVTRNMPGAYGLLPSRTYFEKYGDNIITSDSSLIAAPISSYGNMDDYNNFANFLIDKNSTRNTVTNISQPISLRAGLLSDTRTNQDILDNWVTPDGVDVYEIAGTGLATIRGFNYREFSCRNDNPYCVLIPFLKPMPRFTLEGDGTVVLNSAHAYEGLRERLVVDLKQEGAGLLNKEREHRNLTESKSVQTYLESVIKFPYLTDTLVATQFSQASRKFRLIGAHSPVSLFVRNSAGQEAGKVNGKIVEEITDASYFEFAGSKYIIVPAEDEVTVLLQGELDGRYSLTIEEFDADNEQTLVQEIIGATSTAGMLAEFDCVEGGCGKVVVDYDADGELDVEFGWSGGYQVVNQPSEIVVEDFEERAGSQSTGTRVGDWSGPSGLVAGATTSSQADEFLRMWNQLLEIQVMINELKLYYEQ